MTLTATPVQPDTTNRNLALGLSTGALVWAAASLFYGFQPANDLGWMLTDLGGLVFQIGLLCLLALMIRTQATGTSRPARIMLQVERVLLVPAMVWSLLHAVLPDQRDAGWLAVLDVFWPLSMLGMFVIGIKVAFAGRWRGLARVWPVVAESWAVVTIPAMGVFGPEVGDVVGATHLLVGYATLGLIIAFRPELVRSGK
ncbi:hypothetical protein FDA94_22225 [Herbidospora galbida]|uniref:Uncharacterized protein n=1 Tax=Herbidospora galbida TaxID=2575442 RepID=A0A4U3MC54_9ACTN|nr:hypothetical protein [Herbidospora galbida]TKK86240.1 hypothetical protein FDA94_22225 [Herbidospora galbida]